MNNLATIDGGELASGVYLYRLKARLTNGELTNIFVEKKKLVLLK